MAHECPECAQQCYCDGDDTGGLPDDECVHQCAPEDDSWGNPIEDDCR